MQVNLRKEPRRRHREAYTLLWKDRRGLSKSVVTQAIEISDSGIALYSPSEVPVGIGVYVEARQGSLVGHCTVRNCIRVGDDYRVGLEFHQETRQTVTSAAAEDMDYYEYLQISPKAEYATIHRIYKFMAGRLHPDNPETGDPDRFLLLNRAYEVLSDPQRRTEYDATYKARDLGANPIFEQSEFVNGIEGEANRRLGILSMLYNRRRTNPEHPGVSMFEIERHMAFPREYLDFNTWYLKAKQYVTMGDNAELTLTALGVDYVEANASQIPILQKLLACGPKTTTGPGSVRGKPVPSQPRALESGDSAAPTSSHQPGQDAEQVSATPGETVDTRLK
jgi:curved DNA-binding protein